MRGNENPWWGWSGLTPPGEGGTAQEPAEHAESATEGKGGTAQELTETATNVESSAEEGREQTTGGNDGQEARSEETLEPSAVPEAGVPAEKNAGEAAERRERERLERERTIREEEATKHAELLKGILTSLGLRDAAGKAVETAEDFERYSAEQKAAKLSRELRTGKLSPESLREALMQTPEIQGVLKQAQELTDAAKAKEQEAMLSKYRADMERELGEIRKLNPLIKSTDDIIKMETGPEYARLIRLGVRPSEAYKLANFDAIRSGDRKAAEQAARNAAAGTSHVRSSPTGMGTAVPTEYAENMRKYVPGITAKEIEAMYRKSHGK